MQMSPNSHFPWKAQGTFMNESFIWKNEKKTVKFSFST